MTAKSHSRKIFHYMVVATIALMVILLFPMSVKAESDAIDAPNKIGITLLTCWQPPKGSEGLAATARFSFRRDGRLMGPPRITFSRLGENDARARAFLQSIADAFIACTPLSFTEAFGQSIAGRIFTLQFLPSLRRA